MKPVITRSFPDCSSSNFKAALIIIELNKAERIKYIFADCQYEKDNYGCFRKGQFFSTGYAHNHGVNNSYFSNEILVIHHLENKLIIKMLSFEHLFRSFHCSLLVLLINFVCNN